MNESFVTIPLGYVCISLEEYNDLKDRLDSAKRDFFEELGRATKYARQLEVQLGDADKEKERLKKELETVTNENVDLRFELLGKVESIDRLNNEIAILNEELCRSDEFVEFTSHAKPESKE